ncbi:hypothetical protein GCM10027360_33230 [Amycolatopsis echigonensis]
MAAQTLAHQRIPDVNRTQVAVVGGGQAGLAAGFYLRRAGLDFVILDAQPDPGGTGGSR